MKNVATGHLVGWDCIGDDGEKAYGSEVDERNPSFTGLPGHKPSEIVFRNELEKIRHLKRKKLLHHSTKRKNVPQRERN